MTPVTGPFRTTTGLRLRYGADALGCAAVVLGCSLGMAVLWVEAVVRWVVGR